MKAIGSGLVCSYQIYDKSAAYSAHYEAESLHETYYARTHCHSKVDLILQDAKDLTTVKVVASVDAKACVCKEERPENCPHYVGYLKILPENHSLPEECLTRPKMLCIANSRRKLASSDASY